MLRERPGYRGEAQNRAVARGKPSGVAGNTRAGSGNSELFDFSSDIIYLLTDADQGYCTGSGSFDGDRFARDQQN